MFKKLVEKPKGFLKKYIGFIVVSGLLFIVLALTQSIEFASLGLVLILTVIIFLYLARVLFVKTKFIFFTLVILLVAAILYKIGLHPYFEEVGFFWSKEERYFRQKLEEFKVSGEKEILLRDLTDFEWENVCYAWAYGGETGNGFKNISLDKELPSENEDGKIAIVFINQGRGRVFIVNRGVVDYPDSVPHGTEIRQITPQIPLNNSCPNRGNAALKNNNIK